MQSPTIPCEILVESLNVLSHLTISYPAHIFFASSGIVTVNSMPILSISYSVCSVEFWFTGATVVIYVIGFPSGISITSVIHCTDVRFPSFV
jgi:hypothetical protein